MNYIVRVNLDIKGEKEKESLRFKSAVLTIKDLINNKDKIIILSHRGRPAGSDSKLSLRPIKKHLDRILKRKVIFLPNFDFESIKRRIDVAPPGSVFLMENLRFLGGEQKNSPVLAKSLSRLGDIFINDDFATAHRKNASNVGITKFIQSRMGPTLKREVVNLMKATKNPGHPFVLIVGGAKMADKMGVIRNLINKVDFVLLGGGAANTLLKARGIEIGESIFDKSILGSVRKLGKNKKIILPVDYKKLDSRILDIGLETVKIYDKIIKSAKTIIWGGPMGFYEDKRFSRGSYGVARSIAKSKSFSIVGGGETGQIIDKLGLSKKIDLISTGGGAMLDFLAGKKMPAIEAMNKNKWRKQ